jgi:hypothetical protein
MEIWRSVMNTVIFGAEEGVITVHNDNGGYAKVDAAGILFAENDVTDALIDLGVNPGDDFYNSSSIDYCDEEGFEPGEARAIVDQALFDLKLTLRTA